MNQSIHRIFTNFIRFSFLTVITVTLQKWLSNEYSFGHELVGKRDVELSHLYGPRYIDVLGLLPPI